MKKRGKFTEYKERTGKTTEEALHSKDPHVRQKGGNAKWNPNQQATINNTPAQGISVGIPILSGSIPTGEPDRDTEAFFRGRANWAYQTGNADTEDAAYKRLRKSWEDNGRPKVIVNNVQNASDNKNKIRAHFSPSLIGPNEIHINSVPAYDEYFEELAHAKQFKDNPIKSAAWWLKDAITHPWPSAYENLYKDKSSFEYNAHGEILPNLIDKYGIYTDRDASIKFMSKLHTGQLQPGVEYNLDGTPKMKNGGQTNTNNMTRRIQIEQEPARNAKKWHHVSTGLYENTKTMKNGGNIKELSNKKVKKFKAGDGTNLPGGTQGPPLGGTSALGPAPSGLSGEDAAKGLNAAGPMGQQGGYAAAQGPVMDPRPLPTPEDTTENEQDIEDPINPSKKKKRFTIEKPQFKIPEQIDFKVNTANLMTGMIGTISSLLPDTPINSHQKLLPNAYNPFPNGNNTQAIAEYGKTLRADNGIMLTDADRDAWENMQTAAYQQGFYGDEHSKQPGIDFMKEHGVDPNKLSAYQQDFIDMQNGQRSMRDSSGATTLGVRGTHGGFSGVDDHLGKFTSGQRYTKYSIDNNGVVTNYGTNFNNFLKESNTLDAKRNKEWEGFGDPTKNINYVDPSIAQEVTIPKPVGLQTTGFPTREEAIAKYKERKAKGESLPENYFLKGNEDYSVDSVRKQYKAEFGKSFIPAAEGVQIEEDNYKMLSPHTGMLTGYSHDEKRPDGSTGTDVTFGNQKVEGQDKEPFAMSSDGALNLFGKMYVPGKNVKFDSAIKEIAKKEVKNNKLKIKSLDLVNNSDPHNKYERLTFGAGKIGLYAYEQNQRKYDKQKNALASIQNSMHRMAYRMGVAPDKLAKTLKAEYNMTLGKGKVFKDLSYQDIDETMQLAPDFLGIAASGKKMYDSSKYDQKYNEDILKEQQKMMKDYPDLVKEALDEYGQPNAGKFDDGRNGPRTEFVKNYIAKRQQGNGSPAPGGEMQGPEPTELTKQMWKPNESNYHPKEEIDKVEPRALKEMPVSKKTFSAKEVIPNDKIEEIKKEETKKFKPFRERLGLLDVLGEIKALFSRPRPVPSFQMQSQLMNPYQVSYQAQRNSLDADFNNMVRNNIGNPAAMASLAALKHDQTDQINEKEFNTNNSIFNTIMNTNYGIMNEDRRTNLGLDVQQRDKQEAAWANTEADKNLAINSLAEKRAMVRRSNMTNAMFEKAYHSQGMDAFGRPYHEDNAYFPNRTVSLYNLDADEERKHIIKKYGFDPITGKKISEESYQDKDSASSMKAYTGKKIKHFKSC